MRRLLKTLLPYILAVCFCLGESTSPGSVISPSEQWIHGPGAFTRFTLRNLTLNAAGSPVFTAGSGSDGILISPLIEASEHRALRLVAWIISVRAESQVSFSLRAAELPFDPDQADGPAWVSVRNGQVENLPAGRYFQYRLSIGAKAPSAVIHEVFLDTTPPDQRGTLSHNARPHLDTLVPSMMYQTTLEKLHALHSQFPVFNASERGAYILRNHVGQPIKPDTWQYQPQAAEMYLAARFNTWLVMRLHPGATFSPLTLRPADVVMRTKDGRQKAGPFAQHRAINFFDEQFMSEYLDGIRGAVRFYRQNNPNVIGYNIAPPEFFYDSEPWPEMTYLGGFGDLAKARYIQFMGSLGLTVDSWPTMPDDTVSLDRDYYLWVYWRHWEAYRYLARIARVIREEDPQAEIGALNYVADFGLRGIEPGFIENNPDFTFYYSSNLFPRVPGPDGLTGGRVLSYTRPNVLGHSRKLNLAEFDLWSPYVDLKRMETYARYAQLEQVLPVPIVFGDFITGSPPSNHLTKYHGMTGEPITLPIIKKQGDVVQKTEYLRHGGKTSQVGVIIPSFSLYGILEKGAWKPHRNLQLQTGILASLLDQGVGFDLISEGQVSPSLLDQYKLIVYQNPVATPWIVSALRETKANVLALGWAGSIQVPGPIQVQINHAPEQFTKTLVHTWPSSQTEATGVSFLPTQGNIEESSTTFHFSPSIHPLLRGLQGRQFSYQGKGVRGKNSQLPYTTRLEGTVLAVDDAGKTMFAEKEDHGRRIIHFGGLLNYVDPSGNDTALLPSSELVLFWKNIFDFLGIEHFEQLGALRIMRTTKHLLIENTATTEYHGPIPSAKNAATAWMDSLPDTAITIPAYDSIVLPISKP